MELCWILFIFIHLSTLIHNHNLASGQRFDDSNGCCANYALIEGSCIPCIGTFGNNCSGGPCPDGYYGFGCKSKCNCLPEQQCDRVKGCTNLTVEMETFLDDGAGCIGHHIVISILSILLVISVGMNIF